MDSFHDMWLRVSICDSWMASSLPENELPEVLSALRSSYLEARERAYIPLYFMADYNIQRPADYNHLHNTVYLTLKEHSLDSRISQRLQAIWSQTDEHQKQRMEKLNKETTLGYGQDNDNTAPISNDKEFNISSNNQ